MTNDSGLPESGLIANLRKLVDSWKRAADEEQREDVGPRVMLQCASELSAMLDLVTEDEPVPMSTCRDCGQLFESNHISPHLCEACQAGRGT